MPNADSRRANDLLDSITEEMLLGNLSQLPSDGNIRVERILLELVRPDPVQPRRVLPEAIHFAFHNNRLTPTQALRALVQQVQVAARQRGRPFNSVLELLPPADDEAQDETPTTLSPEELLLRDLVNLAITIREDGQVNPLTVVNISQGAARQFRIETGERRYWASWLLLQQIVSYDATISAQILRVDPMSILNTTREGNDETFVPVLPQSAQLSDQLSASAETVGHFHRDCMTWLSKRSPMTPRIFLESGPLWAVGLAVARRCVLRLGFGDVFPNLYYLWVAPTTYYHKSTGLTAITDMVHDTVPHLLLPATTSPEMLVAKLAGERPANYEKLLPFEQRNEDLAACFAGQRGIIIDEASKLLIPKKYMEGHIETMMEMFDAPRRLERELRGDGKLIVYNPALALIGATTPARLGRYITDSEWEDGLMARFLCLTPTEREIKCVLNGQDLDSHEFPADLKARLLRIYNAFPMPPDEATLHRLDEPVRHPATSALMDHGVFDLFNAYYAALHDMTDPRRNLDERLRGNYGCFSTMALKLALVLAIMDWVDDAAQEAPRITTAHWARGQLLVEAYRASAHRLLDELSIGLDVKNEKKLLDFIARNSQHPPSAREILRGAGMKTRKEVDATLAALLDDGVIEVAERKTNGRPAWAYRLTTARELSSEAS